MLINAEQTGNSLRLLLREFDVNRFSKDHEWRSLFAALAHSEDEVHDPYRRVALQRYVLYLRSRKAALQEIRMLREAQPKGRQGRAPAFTPRATKARFTRSNDAANRAAKSKQPSSAQAEGFWSLPFDMPMGVTLSDEEPLRLLLATYPFRIEKQRGQLRLLDVNAAVAYPLRAGRLHVGRGQQCDIILDPGYREVSRVHLIIDHIDAQTLVITDRSSHGTSVPRRRLVGM